MYPDPAEIFDIQHIGNTLSDARAWDALRKKDRSWWFAFKHLVKHYILLTNFYDTVPPLASGTERVTAKLDALMPPVAVHAPSALRSRRPSASPTLPSSNGVRA